EIGKPLVLGGFHLADDSAYRLPVKVLPFQFVWQSVASEYIVACRACHISERAVRLCFSHARLEVCQLYQAVWNTESLLELPIYAEIAIYERELEVLGNSSSSILKPDLAVVILCDTPLTPGIASWLLDDPIGSPTDSSGIVGAVHPVVQGPCQK